MKSQSELTQEIFRKDLWTKQAATDRLFFWLLLIQWAAAILIAITISPYRWEGETRTVNIHVETAILFGGIINTLPLIMISMWPGWWGTRHIVAVAQMLWSAVLIHLTAGRIETHFHIFVSLAFLAFYRDWRIFLTATLVVAGDHLLRGFYWPESVYGVANPEWWRFLEHGAWVVFEDIVLIWGCWQSLGELKVTAEREAALEILNANIENQVLLRTEELTKANASLASEMKARLQMEIELRQAQKLESIGRLASGVAHEINTPVQYVGDSIHFLRDATDDLLRVLGGLQEMRHSESGDGAAKAASKVAQLEAEVDLPYLLENMPKAFDSSLEGLNRVATIVRSMKEFAHPDSASLTSVDLNHAIENALTMARNEYKFVAELETDLGAVPRVMCHAGEFNQVILNLVVNAAQAIGHVVKGTNAKGRITIRTRPEGDFVSITLADTGCGIPEGIRDRIFDPFFTTKQVGQGTGQGLFIARSVVVDKHQGELKVESVVGTGTTVRIRLPVNGPKSTSGSLKVAA